MTFSLLPRHACVLALVLAFAAPQMGAAQSLWTTPYVPNQVSLELLQPALDTAPDEELSFLTGAAVLSGSYLLNDRTTLTAAWPVAHYRAEVGDDPTTVSETASGNPYLGVGLSSTRVPLLAELGVRLPLAPDRNMALVAGTAADLDHSEAFAPHRLSAQFLLNTRWELSRRSTSLRLRGGPLVTIPTQDTAGTTELFGRYSVQGWYEGKRYVLGLGLTGRALITESGSFNDRTTHQIGGTLIFNFPYVQPGILVRAPLNGPESDAVNLVVGITLSASL